MNIIPLGATVENLTTGAPSATSTLSVTTVDEKSRVLIAFTWAYSSNYANGVPSGVTFDGTAMTKIIDEDVNDGAARLWGCSMYYLIDPEVTTGNVVATYAVAGGGGNSVRALSVAQFTGVDLQDVFRTPASETGSVDEPSLAIESMEGDLVIGCYMSEGTWGNGRGAGQYTINGPQGSPQIAEAGYMAGALQVALSWDPKKGTPWRYAIVGVSLIPRRNMRSVPAIGYTIDLNENPRIIRSLQGSVVHPSELRVDRLIRISGLPIPAAYKSASRHDDLRLFLPEELVYTAEGDSLQVRSSPGQLMDVVMARLTKGRTV